LGDSLIFAEDLGRLFEARREYAAAVDEHFRWLAARPESRPVAEKRITNLIKVPEALPQITEALRQIVAAYPRNEYAHSLYGDLLFESVNPDSAFSEYRRADNLSATPGLHQAKGIGRCLETQQYEVARTHALAFLQQYPEHTQLIQVNLALARAELGLNRPNVAVDMLKELAGQFPVESERSRIEFEIGEIYRTEAGDMDSARVYYSRVAAREGRDPLLPRALMRLGDVEVYFGKLTGADSIYKEALRARARQQDREEIQFRIAEVKLFQGEYTQCSEELKKLVKDHPRGVFVNDALELSVLLSDSKDAMSWSMSRYSGALYAIRRGEYDSASALFSQLVQDSANQVADDALFHLAGLQTDREQYAEALASYRSLITRFPESFLVPRAWAEIGGLFEGPLDNPDEARNAYQTILAEYRNSPLVEEARLRLQRIGMVQ
jgi:tetratricopeptide (TPR) repeat protein